MPMRTSVAEAAARERVLDTLCARRWNVPIVVEVDRTRRVRYASASGVLSDADVLEGYAGVLADPTYDATFDMVFDCTDVEWLAVAPSTIRRIAELVALADRAIPPGVHPRAAIVAPADVAFGMGRMYQARRESQDTPRQYLVCRTMQEARSWLGLDGDR
jgi:hypothetical protein